MESSLVVGIVVAIVLTATFPGCCRTSSEPTAGKATLTKRSTLTFPPDSVLQINAGITLAGHLKGNSAVVVLAFQQNSLLPRELQPLPSPSLVVSAKQFSVYDHLVNILTSYGLNGAECLGKMVCQIGETPLVGGLVEDVVSFVLSPSKHRSLKLGGAESEAERRRMALVLESERLGVAGGNCTAAFPECLRTPLDMISTLYEL